MPASSDRLGVSSLRPWKPAENDPAEPKPLTQSLQLTCSLTPSSTEPSTWLVIIWLKCALATLPIDPALHPAPVGRPSSALTLTLALTPDVGGGVEPGAGCANACPVSPPRNSSVAATTRMANPIQLLKNFAMVSARTAWRPDCCRHR